MTPWHPSVLIRPPPRPAFFHSRASLRSLEATAALPCAFWCGGSTLSLVLTLWFSPGRPGPVSVPLWESSRFWSPGKTPPTQVHSAGPYPASNTGEEAGGGGQGGKPQSVSHGVELSGSTRAHTVRID